MSVFSEARETHLSLDRGHLPKMMPQPRNITTIARWSVHKGDVIGISGDSGYSEGLHIHYTVAHVGASTSLPYE